MHKVSVSNLDCFRQWKADEDLDIGWLMARLQGKSEQTPAMAAGEAFHKVLENATFDELGQHIIVTPDGYQFDIAIDVAIELPTFGRELRISRTYGDLIVSGRVDCVSGNLVIDHKTTAQFDADRLMSGYQWRYYLDILECNDFRWNVFVMRENDEPKHYTITDFHQLEQRRYPDLERDCAKLAAEFSEFAKQYLPTMTVAV